MASKTKKTESQLAKAQRLGLADETYVDCLVCNKYHPIGLIPHGFLFRIWVDGEERDPYLAKSEFDVLKAEALEQLGSNGDYEIRLEWEDEQGKQERTRKIRVETVQRVGIVDGDIPIWIGAV